jgi:thiamine-phosphate pyrophosphorylase
LSEAERWVAPEEIGLRLILLAPAGGLAALPELLAAAPVAAVVVDPLELPEASRRDTLLALRATCNSGGAALLLQGDPRLANEVGAQGVHLDRPDEVKPARQLMAADAIVGLACGVSRHVAMVAGEDGADYVLFGAVDRPVGSDLDDPALSRLVELAEWWAQLFVVPVAIGGVIPPAAVPALAKAGADFVALGPHLWAHPRGPLPALAEIGGAAQQASAERGAKP